jgi:hypothetical protein
MDGFAVVEDPEDLAAKGRVAQIVAQKQTAQELAERAARLVNRVGSCRRPKALKGQDSGCPPAVNGRGHPNKLVPPHVELVPRHIPLDNTFENGGHRELAWEMQPSVPEMAQASTEIKPQEPTDRHPNIAIALRVDRVPFHVGRHRLPHDRLDGRSRLPLV